jgi:uncharacterized membrane protein YphA (DoxX/SURF4 family)
MKRQIAVEVICFLFVILFTYAAASKLLDYQKFTVQIGLSPLLTGFGDFIPWMTIGSEFLVSICLLIPRIRIWGLLAAFSLMTMFTAYIVAILQFSSFVPCSCGGVLEKLGWTEHLVFNSAFVCLALVGIFLQARVIEGKRKEVNSIQGSFA